MARRDEVLRAMRSRGRKFLLAHYDGERLTASQAIIAKCCDCMCYHTDGRIDCELDHCPLYPWMPFKKTRKEENTPDT